MNNMKIRVLEERDLPTRVEWMNSPRIYTNMHYSIPVSLHNTISWYRDNINNTNRIDVVFDCNGEIIAMGGLTGIDNAVKKAELYIFVNPNLHRSGIGTKATACLCKYGFDELGLNKIYLKTNSNNISARRVYEKCGFKIEGVLRADCMTTDGQLIDRVCYGLFRDELNE